MWPFRRKKSSQEHQESAATCPHCGSTDTKVTTSGGESHVKTWRGERYVTWRCLSCGQDFYTDEPQGGAGQLLEDDRTIDDEDALRAAEEDLKRHTDEEGDRRYNPGGS